MGVFGRTINPTSILFTLATFVEADVVLVMFLRVFARLPPLGTTVTPQSLVKDALHVPVPIEALKKTFFYHQLMTRNIVENAQFQRTESMSRFRSFLMAKPSITLIMAVLIVWNEEIDQASFQLAFKDWVDIVGIPISVVDIYDLYMQKIRPMFRGNGVSYEACLFCTQWRLAAEE